MKIFLLVMIATIPVLAGCSRAPEVEPSAAAPPPAAPAEIPGENPTIARYRCENNAEIIASYGEAGVLLELPPEQKLKLKRVVSASGEKFGEEPPTWWIKGEEASLDLPGDRNLLCQEQTAAQ